MLQNQPNTQKQEVSENISLKHSSMPEIQDASLFGRLRNKVAAGMLTAVTAVVGAPKEADAAWTHTSTELANTLTIGAEKLEGIAVWYKGKLNNGTPYVANGTLYDAYTIIGAAHRTPAPNSLATIEEIGTSLDYNHPELGQVRMATSWARHPAFLGLSGENDISRIRVSVPFDLTEFSATRPNGPLPIGTAQLGQEFIFGGYAPYGSPDTGLFPADGKLRGGNTISVENVSSTFQGNTAGLYALDLMPDNIMGTNGMSGGPSFLPSSGAWLGPVVGASSLTPVHDGYTYFTPASNYVDFITAPVPEPSTYASLAVLGIGATALWSRRRRQVSAS